jgi:hypothetical protein
LSQPDADYGGSLAISILPENTHGHHLVAPQRDNKRRALHAAPGIVRPPAPPQIIPHELLMRRYA